ncbi:endoplasmic reticulum resident protein 27 [Amblyraja radiata]|uniref:endoplasmic reticulum resident protein 27 n=1 Tax=Amblyraja radiata TaxID=386614 RepID=UPI001403CB3D|nr:endoplasmic reticulum resident protein 27 [Amblyraja radiata]
MPSRPLLLLVLLSLPSLIAPSEEEGEHQEETEEEMPEFHAPPTSPDVMRPVRVLTTVSRAETFIRSVPVAVIGFLKDMETTEADAFSDVVQMLKRLPFAVASDTSVWKKFNISRNTISLFKKFDEGRADYLVEEGHLEPNVPKIVSFLRIHELHLVTEYNHMDASQIFGSGIRIHLLLLISKTSKEYQPLLDKFKGVAPEFRGKVIFVQVDTDMKQNNRVTSFFKVTEQDLPAICAFHVVTNAAKMMPAGDGTPDSIRRFCLDFMQDKEGPLKKPPSDEL